MVSEEILRKIETGEYKVIRTPHLKHYAKIVDQNGRFIAWLPNPNKGKRRRGTSKYSVKDIACFHGFEKPFCFFCGRTEDELGVAETLELDHILPLREGGKDEPKNIQILCSACHRLRHWAELYITKHLVRKEKMLEVVE